MPDPNSWSVGTEFQSPSSTTQGGLPHRVSIQVSSSAQLIQKVSDNMEANCLSEVIWKPIQSSPVSRDHCGCSLVWLMCVCVCVSARTCMWVRAVHALSHVWLFVTQAPLSMRFSRQEYWSGFPFPTPGDLPNPAMKPESPMSPSLAGWFFTTVPPEKLFD